VESRQKQTSGVTLSTVQAVVDPSGQVGKIRLAYAVEIHCAGSADAALRRLTSFQLLIEVSEPVAPFSL
jgi:hypothetical protein